MSIRLLKWDAFVLDVRTRFPFRYGIASLTGCPHLFVRVELAIEGQRAIGVSADNLPPKWFTKDPATPYRDDVADMVRVVRHAGDAATSLGEAPTLFAFWRQLYDAQDEWAARHNVPPLLAGFGTTLIERAAIDAFCQATQTPFAQAVRENAFGLEGADLGLLPAEPMRETIVRHTVGLSDPITDAQITDEDRVRDGLPQSLERCVAYYGLTHFKIKLGGDPAADLSRLRELARLLDASIPSYAFTLDGNENFARIEPLRELWQAIRADNALAAFTGHLLFLEQPFHRDVALGDTVRDALLAWEDRPPIIIDESDATLDSLPRALVIGYAGTSYKSCKGVFKGVINACRIAEARRRGPAILSGEDLSTLGPISLPQDLAVMASLGVEHVERNGHHYFRGISHLPEALQAAMIATQPDLYRRHERGYATLAIRGGKLNLDSCVDAPFGVPLAFDPSRFTPLGEWRFEMT